MKRADYIMGWSDSFQQWSEERGSYNKRSQA